MTHTEFVRCCLQRRWEEKAGSIPDARVELDVAAWGAMLEVACQEHVAPLLYQAVRDRDVVPLAVEQALQEVYQANAYRNTLLLCALREVVNALAQAAIPVLILKGMALVETVYRNAALRVMQDLDVLVHREHVTWALDVLQRQGYTIAAWEPRPGMTIGYESQIQLFKPGAVEIRLELHWHLIDSPYYQRMLSMDWFWQTAQRIPMGSEVAYVMSPEGQLLHLCAHQALHHSHQATGRLHWLHDVAELIVHYGEQLDWQTVVRQAQAFDLVLPLQKVLLPVIDDWHIPLSASVAAQVRSLQPSSLEERLFTHLTTGRLSTARRFWLDCASLPSWGQRLDYAWSHLFPSPLYMKHRYRIGHRLLIPLFYPYRWFLGLRSVRANAG